MSTDEVYFMYSDAYIEAPAVVREQIDAAVQIACENGTITVEDAQVLLDHPRAAIATLLGRLTHATQKREVADLRADLNRSAADDAVKAAKKARAELAEAVEYISEAKRLWSNIDAVMEPLIELVEHAKHCPMGNLCSDHENMTKLATAIAAHITQKGA